MQSIFSDQVINIAVTGGLVRIDLGTSIPTRDKDGKTEFRLVPTQQLVMPIEGFVRSFNLQEGIVRELIARGTLQKSPEGAPPAEEQPTVN